MPLLNSLHEDTLHRGDTGVQLHTDGLQSACVETPGHPACFGHGESKGRSEEVTEGPGPQASLWPEALQGLLKIWERPPVSSPLFPKQR